MRVGLEEARFQDSGARDTRVHVFLDESASQSGTEVSKGIANTRAPFFFSFDQLQTERTVSPIFAAIYRMEMCTSFIFLSFPFLLLSLFATRKRDSRNNYNVSSFLKRGKKNASSKMKRIQSMSFRRIYIIDRSPSSYKLDQSSCNYEGKTDYRYIQSADFLFFINRADKEAS